MSDVLFISRPPKLRTYQTHLGSNHFFLNGRFLTSSASPYYLLLSLLLALSLPILFLVATARFQISRFGNGGKLSIAIFVWLASVMVLNLFVTATKDPGIVPRGLDTEPKKRWIEFGEGSDQIGGGEWKADLKYLRIKQGLIASKWCETCNTYRPPRTSHCRLCDNCVQHTDHHCIYLNNCIGRRNYTSFFAFLLSSILSAAYAIAFSLYHLIYHSLHPSLPPQALFHSYKNVLSLIVAILATLLLFPVCGLFLYHLRLIITNHTTIEMLRPKGDRSSAIDPSTGKPIGNLFSYGGPGRNLVGVLCRPDLGPSSMRTVVEERERKA